MKKFKILSIITCIAAMSLMGCKKYLDINTDPDTTQEPSNSSVFPAMLSAIPRGLQYDARYISKYTQNLLASANGNADTWDRHGYIAGSDASGDIWRQTYFGLGGNLNYIIQNGINKGEFDYVAASYTLKSLMFQMAADYHGDIIFNDAFVEGKYYFTFNRQDTVYRGVDSLCRIALSYYDQAVGKNGKLSVGDFAYNGNLDKWKKLTYGIMALNFHRYSLKSDYKPDSVIKYCDLAMNDVTDDFVIPFDASKNDDANFYGTYRNNFGSFRQSNFMVGLLDGSILTGTTVGANRDPRLKHLLNASQDTTNGNGGYRGVEPGNGDPFSALTGTYAVGTANWINARKRIPVVWGDSIYANPSASAFGTQTGKFLFQDKAVMPVMTYAQMQFTKAEAAFRKNDKPLAYAAYTNGIKAHFSFINRNYGSVRGNSNIYNGSAISAAQQTAYLASANVKQSAGALTITDIMLQKYIALYGWGFFETWVDLRRFHYTDLDPQTGLQVYKNFNLPTSYFPNNLNKPVYRVRPRYNSEYVWNAAELARLGGFLPDYHTQPVWFSLP